MRRWVPVISLLCLLSTTPVAMAWDGNWTQAKSGDDLLYDDGNSDGKSGTDSRPETFFIPPAREYRDVDPEEMADYANHEHYAPYALARIERNLNYNGLLIPKGYYLIKAGDASDGSPAVNITTQAATAMLPVAAGASPPMDPTIAASPRNTMMSMQADQSLPPLYAQKTGVSATASAATATASNTQNPKPADSNGPGYQVLVFKKLGRVVAVIPIHRKEAFTPPKGLHKMRGRDALVWLDVENYHPVLKFYHERVLYSTDFE